MRKKVMVMMSVILLSVSMFGAGAWANSHLQEIKAYLNNGLKIRVDGKVVQLNDVNGNAVLPITYDGTTYLPVRGVADVLGVAVDYDAEAYEVILGEKLEGIAIVHEDFTDTLYSKDPAHTTFANKNYGEVLFAEPGGLINSFFLYPRGKYQSLYLQIAALVEDIEYIEIKDLDTNALLKKEDWLETKDGLITIKVDVAGVHTVSVGIKKPREGGYVVPLTTSYYK